MDVLPKVLYGVVEGWDVMSDVVRAAAAVPFASVGVDGRIPTTNLTLPPLTSGWVLEGSIQWTAYIVYSDHGRNDTSSTFSGSASSWGSVPIDFQGVAQVGTLHWTGTCTVKDTATGVTESKSLSTTKIISGIAPAKADVLARLGSIPLQVTCFLESTLRQFDDTYGGSGLPVYHQDNAGGGGFGLMQLTNTPTPSIKDISDWRQNVDDGVQKYNGIVTWANNHLKNLRAAHPKLPAWTADQLQKVVYAAYEWGSASDKCYFQPNATFDGWVLNSNAAYLKRADTAWTYEQNARAGNPPWA